MRRDYLWEERAIDKLKTIMKIFVILTAVMVLCATSAFLIRFVGVPSGYTELIVSKLGDEPEKYFVINKADPILLQAISSEKHVAFDSFNEIQ